MNIRYDAAIRVASEARESAERREHEALAKIRQKLADPSVPEDVKARLRARIRNMSVRIKNGAATPPPDNGKT